MAFYGLTFAPGDRILTARAEYASNVIAFLQVAARTGAVVEVVDNDESGQLSVADLRRRLGDGNGPVKLVAITHVPTQGGLVNPAEEVGAATREAGVPFLLDACQSVGQLPGRRRAHRLRPALRHRTQVPARPARNRIPLRPPRPPRPARAAVPRPARGHLDRARPLRDPPGRATLRELGDQLRRQDRPRSRRRLRAVLGPGGDRGPRHRPRRPAAGAPDERGRRARARPGPAPLRHRHLHRRRRPRRRTSSSGCPTTAST